MDHPLPDASGWPSQPPSPARDRIAQATRLPETQCVPPLIDAARSPPAQRHAIASLAQRLSETLRSKQTRPGILDGSLVDGLMHEFALSSHEGIALMCLAEALLRIPDAATRDALIRDKIGQGDWQSHLGHSPSILVNAATWGLVVTGKLVATASHAHLTSALTRLIAKGGQPLIAKGVDLAMRMMGQHFVMGQTIAEALDNSRKGQAKGFCYSYDMLGEAAASDADAHRYFTAYEQAIHAIGTASNGAGIYHGPGISIKLSALHPRYCRAQKHRLTTELFPRLLALAQLSRRYDIGLTIDAEEADRLDLSLDLLEALCAHPSMAGWNGIGLAVQAYQKRAPFVLDYLIDLARSGQRRLMVRLVKGAYWDGEIKRAQIDGLEDFPVFTRKIHTDVSYLACARRMLDAPDAIYPQFATHNAQTVAALYCMAGEAQPEFPHYEFQCLHGMGEALYEDIIGPSHLNRACRIYAPVGPHETLLAYLVRRLLENGANSSFVNRIADNTLSIADLTADPVDIAGTLTPVGAPHPKLARPPSLYGDQRRNSAGLDLSDERTLFDLNRSFGHTPTLAALGNAPPSTLPQCLRRAADLIEADRAALLELLVEEAGKTIPNALGEIREAVDFLRYYAAQAERDPVHPLGVVACISPWNFPLAIFIGQIAAALAAGNTVIAKPAEETPRIALRAVTLLHQAGIPETALHLVLGAGEVGAKLVADPTVQGVLFTGSTEVAKSIHRSLSHRLGYGGQPIALIAETGGINAMIVDSSARPEQVVADVLISAFDSAGQRCSALRLLCLQTEIADTVIDLLKGAMAELTVGDPRRLTTDVGPVISSQAKRMIDDHIAAMRDRGYPIHQTTLPDIGQDAPFVAPTLIEIPQVTALEREVFGPVLHILRFEHAQMDRLQDAINATGYGLTFGLHTRIDETIAQAVQRIRAGNIYINRSMIGAVVGVQPFGGQGLSGTGPKAGGPLYLRRLQTQPPAEPALPPALSPNPVEAWYDWLSLHGNTPMIPLWRSFAQRSRLGVVVELAGPVGECNTYHLMPRGCVLCVGQTMTGVLGQIGAALATGNHPKVVAPAALVTTLTGLPITLLDKWTDAEFDVALFEGDDQTLLALLADVAARPGPIVGVYRTPADNTTVNLDPLLTEKLVSANTAATGGNAQLMTLEH